MKIYDYGNWFMVGKFKSISQIENVEWVKTYNGALKAMPDHDFIDEFTNGEFVARRFAIYWFNYDK